MKYIFYRVKSNRFYPVILVVVLLDEKRECYISKFTIWLVFRKKSETRLVSLKIYDNYVTIQKEK